MNVPTERHHRTPVVFQVSISFLLGTLVVPTGWRDHTFFRPSFREFPCVTSSFLVRFKLFRWLPKTGMMASRPIPTLSPLLPRPSRSIDLCCRRLSGDTRCPFKTLICYRGIGGNAPLVCFFSHPSPRCAMYISSVSTRSNAVEGECSS